MDAAVYWGRLRLKSDWFDASMPKTNMSTKLRRRSPPVPVTILWKRLVGWITIPTITASTTSDQIRPSSR